MSKRLAVPILVILIIVAGIVIRNRSPGDQLNDETESPGTPTEPGEETTEEPEVPEEPEPQPDEEQQ